MKIIYNKEAKQIVDNAVFPIVIEEICGQGLTKRELFAAMAMQGTINGYVGNSAKDVAKWAVECADALIAELNRE